MEAPVNAPVDGASASLPQGGPQIDNGPETEDGGADSEQSPKEDMPSAEEPNSDAQEIVDLWGKLNTEKRDALLKYGDSMIDDKGEDSEDDGGEEEMPQNDGQMEESVIFTKGQLKKINENLASVDMENEKDEKPLQKTRVNNASPKSPFNTPLK